MVELREYLNFVADRVAAAVEKEDWKEVDRLLVLCAETCLDKAIEVSKNVEGNA